MSGPKFFQTGMGHKFFEGDIPKIVEALQSISRSLRAAQSDPLPLKARDLGLILDALMFFDDPKVRPDLGHYTSDQVNDVIKKCRLLHAQLMAGA